MDLTRRQMVAISLAGGFGTGITLQSLSEFDRSRESQDTSDVSNEELRTLSSLATVVYPSTVTETEGLVENYLGYQPPERLHEIRDAIAALDRHAQRRYGAEFAALGPAERERLVRELGVDRAVPDGDGTTSERIRHYLVNGLLFALFTDPAGSRLVGIDNPLGHPGGYESYAMEPDGDSR